MPREQKMTNIYMAYRWALADKCLGVRIVVRVQSRSYNEFRWVIGPPDVQHRFHVDKGFSPSGTVHSSKDVERAQEMPPVAILLCPFLEKARTQKQGISLFKTQTKEAVLRNGKSSQRNVLQLTSLVQLC